MATRGDIRDAFYNELASLSGTYTIDTGTSTYDITLDESDIRLIQPSKPETLPQIVYSEDYTSVTYNGVGTAAHIREYDDNDDLSYIAWKEYVEAQFTITVRASDDLEKEPIYERVRRQFNQYQFGYWSTSDFANDVIDIDVVDARSVDTGEAESVIRGDQVDVLVTYFRRYKADPTLIETIKHNVDVGDGSFDDGSIDDVYTTITTT